jgi:hypothetical protein
MNVRLLAAAAAGAMTLALGGSALALVSVTDGAYTLDDSQFGAQTGVHSDGAQNVASNTLLGHVNIEGSGVTFTTTGLNNQIMWNPGPGEATLSGNPSFSNLLVTFEHGWGTVTFNLMDSTGGDAGSTFNLLVNGAAASFTNPGNCTFCVVNDNGQGKFTVTGPNITTLGFTFDPAIETGKQFRVELPTAVPEPATWAMMILGFGGIGAMMRRRRALAPAIV